MTASYGTGLGSDSQFIGFFSFIFSLYFISWLHVVKANKILSPSAFFAHVKLSYRIVIVYLNC